MAMAPHRPELASRCPPRRRATVAATTAPPCPSTSRPRRAVTAAARHPYRGHHPAVATLTSTPCPLCPSDRPTRSKTPRACGGTGPPTRQLRPGPAHTHRDRAEGTPVLPVFRSSRTAKGHRRPRPLRPDPRLRSLPTLSATGPAAAGSDPAARIPRQPSTCPAGHHAHLPGRCQSFASQPPRHRRRRRRRRNQTASHTTRPC